MHISKSTSLGVAMSESLGNIDDDMSTLVTKDNSIASFKQSTQDVLYSLGFRAMILFQIMAYGSYSVLVHLCEKDGAIAFSSTTMNSILEIFKLIFSLFAFTCCTSISTNVYSNEKQIVTWFRQSLPYSIPGMLYFINNNLAVHMQVQMDPASYQILSNFKILTTAILYRLIIKKKLTRSQWFALLLLFVGGLAYSIGMNKIYFSFDFKCLRR